jgi:hypothetical protein
MIVPLACAVRRPGGSSQDGHEPEGIGSALVRSVRPVLRLAQPRRGQKAIFKNLGAT